MPARSAHDCSDGGLAVAIAECCFSSLGTRGGRCRDHVREGGLSAEAQLFGESPSRIVISFTPEKLERVTEIAAGLNCPLTVIGTDRTVTSLTIKLGETVSSGPLAELRRRRGRNLRQDALEAKHFVNGNRPGTFAFHFVESSPKASPRSLSSIRVRIMVPIRKIMTAAMSSDPVTENEPGCQAAFRTWRCRSGGGPM